MAKTTPDAATMWSLNYRLLMEVITGVSAEIEALGVDSKGLFLLATVVGIRAVGICPIPSLRSRDLNDQHPSNFLRIPKKIIICLAQLPGIYVFEKIVVWHLGSVDRHRTYLERGMAKIGIPKVQICLSVSRRGSPRGF